MDMMERDRGVLWHPYTQMKDFENEPMLFVDRAEGVFLFDNNGGRFYDTISSWWCILHGHNHPRIKAAIAAQMDRLEQVHLAGTTHEGAILLAERLVEMTPANLTKVFYSDNGSTACEVALKMSFQFWKQTGATKREKFVSLERGWGSGVPGRLFSPVVRVVPSAVAVLLPVSVRRRRIVLVSLGVSRSLGKALGKPGV
jgi:adenosylmethionine-8-amino-7-oxononanoate aminotransferase